MHLVSVFIEKQKNTLEYNDDEKYDLILYCIEKNYSIYVTQCNYINSATY